MTDIAEVLKKNRPGLSDGSLRTYKSILVNLVKQMGHDWKTPEEIIAHYKQIHDHLKDVPAKSRKTRLSALIVFISGTKGNEKAIASFRDQMMTDGKETDEQDLKQELTDRQRQGMMSWAEVMKHYEDLASEVEPLLKRETLDKSHFQRVQLFVLLSCIVLIPPRRSLDWCAFKLRNVDKEKDNYLEIEKRKPVFVFNQYKIAKTKGQQREEVPKRLHAILKAWEKLNPHDWLLMNTKQTGPMTPPQLTACLYSFFKQPTSTTMLRHIFLSDKYKDVPALKEMMETADKMGQQNLETALKYVKKT